MSGLEQYQIPYDPQSYHQLHWTPGSHGKGLMTSDGVLHHWNVAGQDGQPQHRRYMMESPSFGYDPYPGGKLKGLKPFWIYPDGETMMLNTMDRPDDILAVDPRLAPPSGDAPWRFSDFSHQQRAIQMDQPPKIMGAEHPDPPENLLPTEYYARRPFIYKPSVNTAYVGRPNQHHDDIHRDYPDISKYDPENYEGYVMKGYRPGIGEDPMEDHAAWFNRAPDNHEVVLDTIANTFGVPPIHFKPETWHFATDVDQRLQDRKTMDPIAFEQKYDWDRPGDVERGNPDIEWVPTHELKKFMEYDRRPGGENAWSDKDRWDALAHHIKTEGFKNPVWLDFNPDTSMAHLSEGNHRVQIALDHGMPALPVRVYRSMRNSPTKIPVNATPNPSWSDSFDPTGYHWPQYMRPSHLGLPTVPPPEQHTAATQHVINWTPGHSGKGLFDGDTIHTWNVAADGEPYSVDGVPQDIGYPTHHDYKINHDVRQQELGSEFWINPEGHVSFFQPMNVGEERIKLLNQIDPRLQMTDLTNDEAMHNGWNFI